MPTKSYMASLMAALERSEVGLRELDPVTRDDLAVFCRFLELLLIRVIGLGQSLDETVRNCL